MHAILLIVYVIVLTIGITRLRFVRTSGIRPTPLRALFLVHLAAGCLHNYIAWRFYPAHGDIWMYFDYSSFEGQRLFNNSPLFWQYNSHWDYVSHNSVTFINIFLNLLSFNNFYINTILFSVPVFLGNIALFRVFRNHFPGDPLTAFAVFLFPSTLFWTSCIHREAALYLLLGFFLLNIHRLLTRGFTWSNTLYGLICFALLVFFRPVFGLSLLPGLFCWCLARDRRARKKWLLVGAVAFLTGLLLLVILDLPAFLARHQQEFLQMQGNSRLTLPALDGSWLSLLRVLPRAALNGWFQPLPGTGGQPVYLAFSIELLLVWLIVFAATLRMLQNQGRAYPFHKAPTLSPFALFCIATALPGMLIIGYMIPFAGAIVRYRSIYLPFLLASFLHSLRSLPLFQAINERLSHCLSHRL